MPRFEKHSSVSCVLATNSLSMKSSSLIAVADLAAAAAPLRLVVADRLRLGVAAVRQRDDDVLRRDQVFDRQVGLVVRRSRCGARRRTARGSRAARRGSLRAAARAARGCRVRSRIRSSSSPYSARILSCSRPVSRCSRRSRIAWACASDSRYPPAVQAELRRQPVGPGLDRAGALEHRGHGARRPGCAPSAPTLRLGRRRRRLDQRDDLVDVRERDRQAFEDVGALARLAQVEDRCGG